MLPIEIDVTRRPIPGLRPWYSTEDRSKRAGEMILSASTQFDLVRQIAELDLMSLHSLTFVILPMPLPCSQADVYGAAKAASAASAGVAKCRLCLAVSNQTLTGISPLMENVGVILDNVDEHTPLSAFTNQAIEAVRFATKFLATAERDMRLGLVLDAMLQLTHDLGLATLGETSLNGNFTRQLDYLPLVLTSQSRAQTYLP